MICIECNGAAKYKCPTCRIPFCSVTCFKEHKTKPCTPPIPAPNPVEDVKKINYEYPTEDTVPLEKLKLLGDSKEVRKCLENPHVRKILERLNESPNPDTIIKDYMQEPIFTEFVDACLNVVQEMQH